MDPELRELLDALLDVNRMQSEQVRDLVECVKILDRRLTLLEERRPKVPGRPLVRALRSPW